MAVSSISCSLRPPAPVREASARLTTQPSPPNTTTAATPWADGLRRACVAAASCVAIGAAGDVAAASSATTTPRDAAAAVVGVAAPRWSDRRECPAWRANSLENVVPENLPRPSARRRFSTVERAPAPALGPRAVAPPLLAPPYGVDECFTL